MELLFAFLILLLVAALAAAISAAILHLKYEQRPDVQWKDKVTSELRRTQSLRATLALRHQRLLSEWEDEIKSLTVRHFGRVLSGIGIHELESFPGIGPQTVARLRDAGYRNLEKLDGTYAGIPGIGD